VRLGLVMEQSLAPVPGGTGRYSRELAAALAGLDDLDVTGWTAWHRDTRPARVPGVRGPVRLPLGRRALTVAWERGAGPRPRAADLVHAATLLAPPRRRRPLVVTVHDAVPWTHPETLTPRGVRWHRRMAERVAASADAVIVPSAATARSLAEHLRLPNPPDVVPLGATPLPVPADAAERRHRLGVPPDGFVLSLATLEPRKGLDVLVRAMAQPQAPDLPLLVVGAAGWGGVDLDDAAGAAGLAPGRVRELGRIDDGDLAAVLAGATVLAVPSRAEGFGLPVLEGMHAGVPVVTSDDPALLEVGGPATVTAPVGDAAALAGALRQACDPAARGAMVADGHRRALGYTWARCAEAHAAVYRRVG
jgi:glycosyltransferase involved in cell wall biosynthesis